MNVQNGTNVERCQICKSLTYVLKNPQPNRIEIQVPSSLINNVETFPFNLKKSSLSSIQQITFASSKPTLQFVQHQRKDSGLFNIESIKKFSIINLWLSNPLGDLKIFSLTESTVECNNCKFEGATGREYTIFLFLDFLVFWCLLS